MKIFEIVEKFNNGELDCKTISSLIKPNERVSLIIKNKRIRKLVLIREVGTSEIYNERVFVENETNRLIRYIKAFNREEVNIKDLENISSGLMSCGCHIMYMLLGNIITNLIIEQDKEVIVEWENDYSE